MRAVILAAGEGRRLRPFTESMPKVMLPVANKPILEYVVNAVTESGIQDIVMVLGYKKERIMDYFGDGKEFDARIKYVFQDEQLGTGHALLQAKKEFDTEFLVLPGDNLIDAQMLSQIVDKDGVALLFTQHDMPSKYGVVTVDNDLLTSIVEKPKEELGHLISTGIYKFEKAIAKGLEDQVSQGSHTLTGFLQSLLQQGETIGSVRGDGTWQDAVYPWDLLQVNETALHQCPSTIAGKVERGVEIKGQVLIGEGTIIRSGSYIVGPVVIGKGCEIGPNACIFPSTSIGDHVTVHAFCELRNSIVMNDVTMGTHSLVAQSVIGEGCTIGANFATSVGGAYVNLGYSDQFHKVQNIGCFMGDMCTVGGGVVVDPGCVIGKQCTIGSLSHIAENVKSESTVV